MNPKLMECITHPVKCKLLLELQASGTATAKHLAEIYTDIPQATLYRHLKRMTSDGILKVVEETQVRGTVEKTYAVAIELNSSGEEFTGEHAGEAYMQLFQQYILGFIKRFQDYCRKPDIDIIKDLPGFSLAPIYATDEELKNALQEYARIITPLHQNRPAPGRRARTLGYIISPPEDFTQ